jgi:molecular chaperone HtpG
MTIINELKKRSENPSDDVKIELKLYTLADDLEKKARAHLKRITNILPEFDIHDEKHSEKVIFNIEQLLGSKKIKELSSYELFFLYLVSYFHDAAMAPSDWEINTLKLTEGTINFSSFDCSIKHDLKTPLKLSSAIELIEKKKDILYHKFEGDVKAWLFNPKEEKELVKYLASLLIDYQSYRNGFADKIKKIKNQNDFDNLNEFIRIDYIRVTHHTRIETYIRNLESLISNAFEQPAWGKKLAKDLALVCRSHGEDANFINQFNTNVQYYGAESTNLQFIAILLRLGDIIHFSFDRAPFDLRSSRLFKSEYSFQEWAVKNSGVNYTIDNGKISFRAYCETPETYFKLHQYIKWIENEIQNYFILQRQWNKTYIENLKDKVDTSNIANDTRKFLPQLGLSFSLNQNKIIELLMGVGLYKDKFACLRELYQNSLDACRCALSENKRTGISTNGLIEFSLIQEEDDVYLSCFDNGIGMSKDIIERYLLKIGNSYYKSPDFYKQQANWGGTFTPTSQFGIGILSCFMIGNKIEITSKMRDNEYVSCSINGPHENFYYKTTTELEKEKVVFSGTWIKILLNDDIKSILINSEINKLGLLLFSKPNRFGDNFEKYAPYYKNWEHHLYNKINEFVQIIPNEIEVNVTLSNNKKIPILSKPMVLDLENKILDINNNDLEFIHYLDNYRRIHPLKEKYSETKEYVETYIISVAYESLEYKTTLTLPKINFDFQELECLYTIPMIGNYGVCIDGIFIGNSNSIGFEKDYSQALVHRGVMNFTGEKRPQLSVDRTQIVNYQNECEVLAKDVAKLFVKKVLEITKKHNETHKIKDEVLNLTWKYVFEKINFADTYFINELSLTEYGDVRWEELTDIINQKISIKAFLSAEEITFNHFDFSILDVLTQKLILTKFISANTIEVAENHILLKTDKLLTTSILKRGRSHSDNDVVIFADKWAESIVEYDIVSNLYPFMPPRLSSIINHDELPEFSQSNKKIKILHAYSNGITAFFTQSPLLINERLGLYSEERDSFGKKKRQVYSFEKKRANFWLSELNERNFNNENIDRYVLIVFIAPQKLTEEEKTELEKIRDVDSSYYKGVNEGWSLLVTGMKTENVVIIPGKCTRKELVAKLSDSFWQEYDKYIFKFTDGTVMGKTT